MKYYYYINHTRKRGCVHISDCHWCNNGNGVNYLKSRSGDEWSKSFKSSNDALQYARRVKPNYNIQLCKHCGGNRELL